MPSNFNTTPTSTTSLGVNQFPVSAVFVPGTSSGNTTALQGGPASTDSNSYTSAPMATYTPDGNDVAQGTTTDAVYSGSGAGTVIALLKKLVSELSATLAVSGTVIANQGGANWSQDITEVGGTAFALGQAAMAASLPVTIANNQTVNLLTGSPAFLFKEVKNVAITAGTPVSIWAPATGKKFRMIGVNLYPTGTATSAIILEDGSGGAANEFLRLPRLNSANTAPTPLNFYPNGYLSSTTNNQLYIDVSVSCSVEGFVWGWEE